MRVFVAHTGKRVDLDIKTSDSVSNLQQSLAQHTDIATQEQILICQDGTGLDPRRELLRYANQLKDEASVFVFSKSHLISPPQQSQSQLDLDAFEFEVPSDVPSSQQSGASTNPFLRSLIDFQSQFDLHTSQAQAFIEGGNRRTIACHAVVDELHVMVAALNAAINNLNHHKQHVVREFQKFQTKFQETQKKHQSMLDSFEGDLAQLRRVDLHPKLRVGDRATLLDCVAEGKLRSWHSECRNHFDRLRSKFADGIKAMGAIERGTEDMHVVTDSVTVLEPVLRKTEEIRHTQQTLFQSLDNDSKKAEKLIAETVAELNTSKVVSVNPADACAAFDLQNRQHNSHIIPQFVDLDRQLQSIMQQVAGAQFQIHSHFCQTLATISKLQSSISDLRKRMVAYDAGMTRQQKLFEQIEILKNMPQAYHACLTEIVRRRHTKQLIETERATAQTKLDTMTQNELARRDAFVQKFGAVTLNSVMPSLLARAPMYEIVMRGVDADLPDIEVTDLAEDEQKSVSISLLVDQKTDSAEFRAVLEHNDGFNVSMIGPGSDFKEIVEDRQRLTTKCSDLEYQLQLKSMQQEEAKQQHTEAIHQLEITLENLRTQQQSTLQQMSAETAKLQAWVKELEVEAEERKLKMQADLAAWQNREKETEKTWRERMQKLETEMLQLQKKEKEVQQAHNDVIEHMQAEIDVAQQKHRDTEKTWGERSKSEAELRQRTERETEKTWRERVQKLEAELQAWKRREQEADEVSGQKMKQLMSEIEMLQLTIKSREEKEAQLAEKMHTQFEEKIATLTTYLRVSQQKLRECQANSADLENKFHKADQELVQTRTQLAALKEEKQVNEKARQALENQLKNMSVNSALLLKEVDELRESKEIWQEISRMKISFTSLQVKDVALFYPDEKNHYLAFCKDPPLRFLSPDSQHFIHNDHKLNNFLVGEIVHIERLTAENTEHVANGNPYGLPVGTEYSLLTVELLKLHSQPEAERAPRAEVEEEEAPKAGAS